MKRQLSLYVEVCSLKKVVSSVSPDNSAAEYTGLKKGPGTKEQEIESLKADLLEKQLAYELFTARNIQLGIAVAKSKSERGDQHVKFLELGLTGPSLLATPILLLLIISGFCSSHLIFNSMALFLRFHFRGILRDGPAKDLGAAECYNLSCDTTSRTALVKGNDLSRQVEQPVGG